MMFEQSLVLEKISPAAIIDMNAVEAIKQTVMKGFGITIISRIAVQSEIGQQKMIELPWEEQLETGVCRIWHKNKWISPILSRFMDAFRQG